MHTVPDPAKKLRQLPWIEGSLCSEDCLPRGFLRSPPPFLSLYALELSFPSFHPTIPADDKGRFRENVINHTLSHSLPIYSCFCFVLQQDFTPEPMLKNLQRFLLSLGLSSARITTFYHQPSASIP